MASNDGDGPGGEDALDGPRESVYETMDCASGDHNSHDNVNQTQKQTKSVHLEKQSEKNRNQLRH